MVWCCLGFRALCIFLVVDCFWVWVVGFVGGWFLLFVVVCGSFGVFCCGFCGVLWFLGVFGRF